MSLSAALILGTLALIQQPQSLAVEQGTRLAISSVEGQIVIRTSTRNVVEMDDRRSGVPVRLTRSGRSVEVEPATWQRDRAPANDQLTIPAWMPVSIGGVNLSVRAEGLEGTVRIETINGDITVRGGRGLIALSSVSGNVRLNDGDGRMTVSSINGEIDVENVSGALSVETSNGNVTLTGVQSAATTVNSVNGSIVYDGTIVKDGEYKFSTHNGQLRVLVPPDVSATVSVSTYRGEFETDFPATLSQGRITTRFRFVIAGGGASIDLESFQGSIALLSRGRRR